jgi:hypothetical protein
LLQQLLPLLSLGQYSLLLTFIASTYYLVLSYPTPVAISDSLRRD